MKEIKEIVAAYEIAIQAGKKTALATVVQVEGSSYRRPGARMLVTEDGQLTGAISGGCLEGDALRKARLVITQHKSLLVTYDTMDDDDAKLGVGLGCNGIIHILIEPIDQADAGNPIQKLKQLLSKRQEAILVTMFCLADRHASQPGTCLMVEESGRVSVNLETGQTEALLISEARKALQAKASLVKNFLIGEQTFTAFIEFIPPAVSLVIIGAGNDIVPLVQMASMLGWETTVVDGRHNYATLGRFPTATRVLVAKAPQVLNQVCIDSQTAFVLMTHNFNYDCTLLKDLIQRQISYIGVLGPKKKMERMLTDLMENGIYPTNRQLASIFGPVGLDIGAETSEEIALSVLAEIRAVLNRRAGKFLRDKKATIHARHPLSQIPQAPLPEENQLSCNLSPLNK